MSVPAPITKRIGDFSGENDRFGNPGAQGAESTPIPQPSSEEFGKEADDLVHTIDSSPQEPVTPAVVDETGKATTLHTLADAGDELTKDFDEKEDEFIKNVGAQHEKDTGKK